jgi:hypothetical protein
LIRLTMSILCWYTSISIANSARISTSMFARVHAEVGAERIPVALLVALMMKALLGACQWGGSVRAWRHAIL